MSLVKAAIEKGRNIKSRGIALTHKDQGYSANNRYVSLLTKSKDLDPNLVTVDLVKALEQVELKISMEEFLRRFFDMWSSDAELLTKALGMTTEFEQNIADNPPDDDSWEADWNERHQKYMEERLSSINIIKKAKSGQDLNAKEQYELFKTRKAFEEGCEDLAIKFSNDPVISVPEVTKTAEPKKGTEVVKTTGATTESSAGATTHTDEETPVDKEVDVTKSQQFIDLMKANEALVAQMKGMEGTFSAAQEIVKAQKAATRAVAVEKAASFTFVAADQREAIADVIENPAQATLVAVLEKAAADLKASQEAIAAKDAEIAEVKKSFADGKEIGAQGELTKAAKGAEDAQAKLNEIIKARAANLDTSKLTA